MTVLFERSIVDGPHLIVSILCGLLALLIGAVALGNVESAVLQLAIAEFLTRWPRDPLHPKADPWLSVSIAHELTYCLFQPNRPPPTFA